IAQKATLIYYRDVPYTDADFPLVQRLGLKGYLPGWEARLNEPVDSHTLTLWRQLSKLELIGIETGKTTRLETLRRIAKEME
ncbi:MAG: FAD-dependent oxidoreductase, partial [Tannerella sp.]|nr:FAD-dependent oxidoreductase [Tannerella sp.]